MSPHPLEHSGGFGPARYDQILNLPQIDAATI